MNLNLPFASKILYKATSPFNGEMEVVELGTRRRLTLGSFNYSLYTNDPQDFFLDRYWGKLAQGIWSRNKNIKRVLILGLGGGTFVYLLNHYYQPEVIDGIEIDPEIVKIGRQYFYLSKFTNLNIFTDDAYEWVNQNKDTKAGYYDLLIFDMYHAAQLPEACENVEFLKKAFGLLNKGGLATFNRVTTSDRKREIVDDFKAKISPYFAEVEEEALKGAIGFHNYILYALKKGE